jgi:hypothetical protein
MENQVIMVRKIQSSNEIPNQLQVIEPKFLPTFKSVLKSRRTIVRQAKFRPEHASVYITRNISTHFYPYVFTRAINKFTNMINGIPICKSACARDVRSKVLTLYLFFTPRNSKLIFYVR